MMKKNEIFIICVFEFAMGFAAAWHLRRLQYYRGKQEAYDECHKVINEVHDRCMAEIRSRTVVKEEQGE